MTDYPRRFPPVPEQGKEIFVVQTSNFDRRYYKTIKAILSYFNGWPAQSAGMRTGSAPEEPEVRVLRYVLDETWDGSKQP